MEQPSSKNNEIDMLDIALTLWAKRISIVAYTVVFFATGILFAYSQTTIYRGEIVVHPLISSELAEFDSWNVYVTELRQIDALAYDLDEVTPELLTEKFRTHFQRGDALGYALTQHSEEIRDFDGGPLESAMLMDKLKRNFVLVENQAGELSIEVTTGNKAETVRVLTTMLATISQTIKQQSLQDISSALIASDTARQSKLRKIEIDLAAFEQLYAAKKRRIVALLLEQASIARALNLKTPFPGHALENSTTGFVKFDATKLDMFDSNYFLRGYDAIEKQIDNIQNRTKEDIGFLLPDADYLILRREKLKRYDLATTIQKLVDASPFNDPNFRVVKADLTTLSFVTKTQRTLLAAIFGLVGLVLSMIIVIGGHDVRMRKNEKRTA